VVSMPSLELFFRQSSAYRDEVLPPGVRARVVIEAGVRHGWDPIATEDGDYVVMTSFGASAPDTELAKHFGFTKENIVAKAKGVLARLGAKVPGVRDSG
ncbi:transketolase, partial [Candidatus Poribacteria bacterium]|nr:transketolase [Candidatus Poribacteria bacterium]